MKNFTFYFILFVMLFTINLGQAQDNTQLEIENGDIKLKAANGVDAFDIGIDDDGNLIFERNGSETNIGLLINDDNGNVGIGTITPTAKLDVEGRVRVNGNTDGTAWALGVTGNGLFRGAELKLTNSDGSKEIKLNNTGLVNDIISEGAELNLTTVNNEDISIFGYGNTGDVSIGTNSNAGKLYVHQSGSGEVGLWADNNASVNFTTWALFAQTGSSGQGQKNAIHGVETTGFGYAVLAGGDLGYTGALINVSDKKLKTKIQDFSALDILKQLKPKTYHYKVEAYKEMGLAKGKRYGFIAQDIQQILPELVKESNYSLPSKEGERSKLNIDYSGVDYISFIPILTRAMQEQQLLIQEKKEQLKSLADKNLELEDKVTTQQLEINDLKKQINQLNSIFEKVITLETNLQSCCLQHHNSNTSHLEQNSSSISDFHTEIPQLQQNFPNPFNQQTEIQYYLPTSAQSAELHITDLSGKTLKTYTLSRNGIGKVMLNGGELAAGTYAYTLVVDGQIVDTKQMILTK